MFGGIGLGSDALADEALRLLVASEKDQVLEDHRCRGTARRERRRASASDRERLGLAPQAPQDGQLGLEPAFGERCVPDLAEAFQDRRNGLCPSTIPRCTPTLSVAFFACHHGGEGQRHGDQAGHENGRPPSTETRHSVPREQRQRDRRRVPVTRRNKGRQGRRHDHPDKPTEHAQLRPAALRREARPACGRKHHEDAPAHREPAKRRGARSQLVDREVLLGFVVGEEQPKFSPQGSRHLRGVPPDVLRDSDTVPGVRGLG